MIPWLQRDADGRFVMYVLKELLSHQAKALKFMHISLAIYLCCLRFS